MYGIVARSAWALTLVWLCQSCAVLSPRTKGDDPESMYTRATEYLDDGLYPEATQTFTDVKTKHPYSRFAALAELGLGDTHFKQGNYLEAVDTYRQFLKFHPSHAKADYAMFRIGEAHFEQIPGEWWFMPPVAEKDQAASRLAISAYRDMLNRFPQSEFAETAQEKLVKSRQNLANHELYVAEFYFKKKRYLASAGRAEGLLRNYPGVGLEATALLLAAKSRHALGENLLASAHANRLVNEFPQSNEASQAQQLLRQLPPAAPVNDQADSAE